MSVERAAPIKLRQPAPSKRIAAERREIEIWELERRRCPVVMIPDRNLFPEQKWSEYVSKIELLASLQVTRKELDRSTRMVERDVNRLTRELVAAIRNGAAIERSGRLVG